MSFITSLNQRFRQPDLIQVALLFFTIIFVAFLVSWPSNSSQPNDSFFAVSQTRLISLLLISLGFGSAFSIKPFRQQQLTGAAVIGLSIFSMPFEVAAYGMSFPSLPLYWSLLVSFIDTIAFFGLGVLLGQILTWTRLRFLLPLMVPSIIAGLIALDILLQYALFNPLTALTNVSLPHLFLMTVCATLCLAYFLTKKDSINDQIE